MTMRAIPAAVGVTVTIVLAACLAWPAPGSKGTMPPPGPNGEIGPGSWPDYVAVAGEVGIVGYVTKDAVLDAGDRTWPVYGEDLRTVVGHLVPGRGFVPAGVDPDSVPTFEVHVGPATPGSGQAAGVVRVYVRNGASIEAWLAVLTHGQVQSGGAGFPGSGYVGVACLAVPDASLLVMLDRSPADVGAGAVRTLFVGGTAEDPVILWLDVAADRTVQTGTGRPEWWASDPPPC